MFNNKITLKEWDITIKDAKSILKVYFDSKDENYKYWFREITPFKDVKYAYKKGKFSINLTKYLIFLLQMRDFLNLNIFKEKFAYNWFLFIIDKPKNKEFDIKVFWNNNIKWFFRIVNDWKNLKIQRMISLQKWFWRIFLKELCDYYNNYNIIAQPSIYWRWFWEKMKKEYKWKINITII